MRLFIAINLNEEIKNYLADAIRELKNQSVSGNFTHRENLHLTLVFLGELGEGRISGIKSVMDRVHVGPFRLSLSGFGRFKRQGGDIHWAGIEKNGALYNVQKQLTEGLRIEGFSLEERDYSPHLTLGREIRLKDPGQRIFASLDGRNPKMTVTRISLMKSERINGKLTYTEVYGRDFS